MVSLLVRNFALSFTWIPRQHHNYLQRVYLSAIAQIHIAMHCSVLRSIQPASRRVALGSQARNCINRGIGQFRPSIIQETLLNLTKSTGLQTRFVSSNSNEDSPGQSSNTRPTNPASSDPDSASINASRATDSRTGSPDTASIQNPVSNPSQGGAAQQEEPQQSWENMRRDPSEPDEVKRAHVEKEGQKPLDAADK